MTCVAESIRNVARGSLSVSFSLSLSLSLSLSGTRGREVVVAAESRGKVLMRAAAAPSYIVSHHHT